MIELSKIYKNYVNGALTLPVLQDVSLTIKQGEFVAIMGRSGSGKTTLMNILGCLDTIDSGKYVFSGTAVSEFSSQALAKIRSRKIGFVFQQFNLISHMSAQRNVELPLLYTAMGRSERKTIVAEQLRTVGLSDRANHLPNQLSGGQQQRVAIARALVNQPNVLVADEPTGSLDSSTGADIMKLFVTLHDLGMTIVMVTHEQEIARYASRAIMLKDGRVENDLVQL